LKIMLIPCYITRISVVLVVHAHVIAVDRNTTSKV
jgi:hypothetical protein